MKEGSPDCSVGRSACAAAIVVLLQGCDVQPAASERTVRTSIVTASAAPAADADPLRGCLERLSDPALKQLYADCAGGALASILTRADLQTCSLVYDVLLKRTFAGDFLALWSWSRNEATVRAYDAAP